MEKNENQRDNNPLPFQLMAKAIIPQNLGEMLELAKHLAESSLVPDALAKKPANVLVAIGAGLELGISPFQAVQNIAVINGRATVYGDMLLGVAISHTFTDDNGRQKTSIEYFKEADQDEIKKSGVAWCIVKRRNWPDPVKRTFSMEDAKRAGLLLKKGPWSDYPERMLMFRARSWALRDSCPDILKGVAIREEVEGFLTVPGEVIPEPKEIKKSEPVAEPKEKKPEIVDAEVVDLTAAAEERTLTKNERLELTDAVMRNGIKRDDFIRFIDGKFGTKSTVDLHVSSLEDCYAWIEAYNKK